MTERQDKREEEITCPSKTCDQVRHGGDSWEASDEGEHTCEKCGMRYEWSRDVSVDYDTIEIINQKLT